MVLSKYSPTEKKSFKDYTPDERKFNKIKSKVIEKWVCDLVQKEGGSILKTYKTISYFPYNVLNVEEIKNLRQGSKILEDIELILEDRTTHLPDYICVKDNRTIFIEVKSSDVKDKSVIQKTTMQKLRQKGYETLLLKVPFTIDNLCFLFSNKGSSITLKLKKKWFEQNQTLNKFLSNAK